MEKGVDMKDLIGRQLMQVLCSVCFLNATEPFADSFVGVGIFDGFGLLKEWLACGTYDHLSCDCVRTTSSWLMCVLNDMTLQTKIDAIATLQ